MSDHIEIGHLPSDIPAGCLVVTVNGAEAEHGIEAFIDFRREAGCWAETLDVVDDMREDLKLLLHNDAGWVNFGECIQKVADKSLEVIL